MQNLSTVSGARDEIIVLAHYCYGFIHLVRMHKRGERGSKSVSTSCVQGGGEGSLNFLMQCTCIILCDL